MIRKVAKVQALREAFPEDFEGMYVAEESGITEPLPEVPVDVPEIVEETTAESEDFADILED